MTTTTLSVIVCLVRLDGLLGSYNHNPHDDSRGPGSEEDLDDPAVLARHWSVSPSPCYLVSVLYSWFRSNHTFQSSQPRFTPVSWLSSLPTDITLLNSQSLHISDVKRTIKFSHMRPDCGFLDNEGTTLNCWFFFPCGWTPSAKYNFPLCMEWLYSQSK